MTELLHYELADGIATITMDDGKVNCLSPTMLGQLSEAFDRAEADGAVVVLSGRPGVFSAGFDLAVFKRSETEAAQMVKTGAMLAQRLLAFPLPVVAACTGHALAMGAFLAMSVDVRVGAQGPFKIGLTEVKIGMILPHFAVEITRHRLSPAEFDRATVTAHMYTPDEAVPAGFLDRVAPQETLAAEVQRTAGELRELDFAAHAATKLRVRDTSLKRLQQAIDADFG